MFTTFGPTASWIGQAVGAYLGYFGYAAGILIIAIGLHFLGVFRTPFLDRTACVGVTQKPAGLAAHT